MGGITPSRVCSSTLLPTRDRMVLPASSGGIDRVRGTSCIGTRIGYLREGVHPRPVIGCWSCGVGGVGSRGSPSKTRWGQRTWWRGGRVGWMWGRGGSTEWESSHDGVCCWCWPKNSGCVAAFRMLNWSAAAACCCWRTCACCMIMCWYARAIWAFGSK
jgi:hypothetical protein